MEKIVVDERYILQSKIGYGGYATVFLAFDKILSTPVAIKILKCDINEEAAIELAKRSRGTPRIANRLFKRVRDFALVSGSNVITIDIMRDALSKLKVDEIGLDDTDYNLLLDYKIAFT